MKESAIYQEILQEGEQRGLLKGKLDVAQKLLERGLPTSEVISITGLSLEDLSNISSLHQ
jgi:predicted transposase/invertase (TIGR01784 family)